jgi:ABC-type sugar transport system substrate-binding protein
MQGARKAVVVAAFFIVLAGLIMAAAGCGTSNEDQQEQYQRGYNDGIKAEQAKWSDQKLQLAKTVIEEEEQSQENIQRLLNGQVTGITVSEVKVEGDTAQVRIAAHFTDGTVINGTVDLVRIGNNWHMQRVTADQGSTPS